MKYTSLRHEKTFDDWLDIHSEGMIGVLAVTDSIGAAGIFPTWLITFEDTAGTFGWLQMYSHPTMMDTSEANLFHVTPALRKSKVGVWTAQRTGLRPYQAHS